MAIILNFAAIPVAVLSFFLLSIFAASVRPGLINTSGTLTVLGGAVGLAVMAGLMFLFMTIHELIHGFFFWVFTRSKPVYALRLFYAYAGTPDWYIPTRQFMIVALGPLVIIAAAGLLFILLVPISWIMFIIFFVALNTGGSIGDLFIFTRLLKLSPTSLANDTGDVITFYEQQPKR